MNLLESFKPVKTFVFDLDGVLTDGGILVFETGEQVRQMNVKDGYALQLAVKEEYGIIVISGGNGVGAELRLQKLGIRHIFLNVKDKVEFLNEFLRENGLSWNEILYMGDDIPDYGPMLKAGMPCAPSDAAPEILEIVKRPHSARRYVLLAINAAILYYLWRKKDEFRGAASEATEHPRQRGRATG